MIRVPPDAGHVPQVPSRFTEIDFYGKRLEGCLSCNVWIDTNGAWRKIPEEDIEALKGLKHTKPI